MSEQEHQQRIEVVLPPGVCASGATQKVELVLPAPIESPAVEALQPWVPSGLVILGWLVVHITSEIRAKRQEEAALVDKLAAFVDTIRDEAVSYFTSSTENEDAPHVESRLKLKLQTLHARVAVLRARKPGKYDLDSELAQLRKAVTGKEFESDVRRQLKPSDPIVQNVWATADHFVSVLHSEFERANAPLLRLP